MRMISLVSALALAACTVAPPPATLPPDTSILGSLAAFQSFTVADLSAAYADAQSSGDVLAAACYPALIKFVQGFPAAPATVSGAFSAFQKARDVRHGLEGGLPDYLKLGCAPLVIDEQQLIARLALIGAGAAATAGSTLLVPFVPIQ